MCLHQALLCVKVATFGSQDVQFLRALVIPFKVSMIPMCPRQQELFGRGWHFIVLLKFEHRLNVAMLVIRQREFSLRKGGQGQGAKQRRCEIGSRGLRHGRFCLYGNNYQIENNSRAEQFAPHA